MEQWEKEMAAIRAAMAENMKGFAELRELQKINEEEARIRSEEARIRSEKADKREAKADKRLKRLEELVGGINRNTGLYAEQFFRDALADTKTFAGIKFEKFMPNLKVEKKETCEFDVVMVNGDSIAIIEIKNRIHPSFVEELATKKIAQFRKFFPEYKDYKVYLGVAGFSFDDFVVEKAKEYGIAVLRQRGKFVEVDAEKLKSY